jgi:tetratricopeptide (TPR) repeat protein
MPLPRNRKTGTIALAGVVAASVILSVLALLYIFVTGENVPGYAVEAQRARDASDVTAERAALEALSEADPQHVESLQRLARIARQEGRFIDAARQWGEVAVLDPMHAEARFEQARNLYAVGDYRRAIELLSLESERSNPDAQALHAMALLGTGRVEEADAIIARVSASDPGHAPTRLLAADRLFLDDRLDEAEAAYRGLLDVAEVAAGAHLGLVQILIRRGDQEKAVALMRQRPPDDGASYQLLTAHAQFWRQTGHLDQALTIYRRLLERQGPLPDVVVPLAELTASKGDAAALSGLRDRLVGTTAPALAARHYLDAMASYVEKSPEAALQRLGWSERFYGNRDLFRWIELDAALRLGRTDRAGAAVRVLKGLNLAPLRLGHAADLVAAHAAQWADRGEYATAEVLAKLSLDLQADHAAARLALARATLIGGRAEEAAAIAGRLLKGGQLTAGALEILGRASMEAGDMEAAEANFRELARTLPDASTGPYWLGVCLFRQGDYADAVAHLRVAYERNPEPRVSAALLDALIRAEDWDGALALAEEQIARPEAPARAIGWAYKAGVHRARGEPPQSVEAYRKAMEEQPDRVAYALAAADLLIDLGEHDDARQILDQAAQKAPDHRVLRFKRGYLAQLMGEADTATRLYRGLLADFPDWALVMVNLSELLGEAEESRSEAVELASRAAELTPRWQVAQWNLAQRAMEAGERDRARQAARQVLDLSPGHADARALLAELDQRSPQ